MPAPGRLAPIDEELKEAFTLLPDRVTKLFEGLQFERAIEAILEAVRRANKYIAETQPWLLAKDEVQSERLDTVLYSCVEALRCASVLLSPVIPDRAEELRRQLGLSQAFSLDDARRWDLTPARTKTNAGDPLFPRVDLEALREAIEAGEAPLEHKPEVTIDDFAKLEFRVAEVVRAEPHPKADKLLVITVKLGSETRTVVSGIKEWYRPEELIGKKVIVVANLKPVKLRGVQSQGMVLAAEDAGGNLSLATLDRDLASGSEVR